MSDNALLDWYRHTLDRAYVPAMENLYSKTPAAERAEYRLDPNYKRTDDEWLEYAKNFHKRQEAPPQLDWNMLRNIFGVQPQPPHPPQINGTPVHNPNPATIHRVNGIIRGDASDILNMLQDIAA